MICPACGAENRAGARSATLRRSATHRGGARGAEGRDGALLRRHRLDGAGRAARPGEAARLMAEYFAVARAAIERHGGTVEKFIGDAVMAVFGVPTVREDDALRAVRAALELRDAAQIDVRIGVNTGEVVTGTGETLVTGDAVNVAARLEQAAGAGEVLIGEPTYALVRTRSTPSSCRRSRRRASRSRSRPTALRVADRRRGVRAPHGRAARRPRARAASCSRTRGSARAPRARVCSSRFSAAPASASRGSSPSSCGLDGAIVSGRCLSYGEGITYWPVVEAVKQLLARRVCRRTRRSRRCSATETPPRMTSRSRCGGSSSRPRASVRSSSYFDDLQWAEPTFLDLIEHVTDWSRDAPLLVLCLRAAGAARASAGVGRRQAERDDRAARAADRERDGRADRALLGSADLAVGLRERIAAAAEGQPAVRRADARDGAGLPRRARSPCRRRSRRCSQLGSTSCRAASERRSSAARSKDRCSTAARFRRSRRTTPSIPAQLMGLVRKELVRPTAATLPEDDAFRFRHLLIRDAAYDALPKAIARPNSTSASRTGSRSTAAARRARRDPRLPPRAGRALPRRSSVSEPAILPSAPASPHGGRPARRVPRRLSPRAAVCSRVRSTCSTTAPRSAARRCRG